MQDISRIKIAQERIAYKYLEFITAMSIILLMSFAYFHKTM
jgi:hypothetical protein